MATRLLAAITIVLSLVAWPILPAFGANPDSIKDTPSDARKAVTATHTIVIDMSASTTFTDSESFTFTFAGSFTVPAFTPSDVTFNDGTDRTVLASCAAGANNIGLDVTGQVITLTACSGYVAGAAGTTVTIVFGAGSTKITNPSSPGLYGVTIAGSYGDDSRTVTVAIIEGVTVSLTIPAPTGDVRFTGDAFPSAIVTIMDGGAVVGTTVANATSFFDKTIAGLQPVIHTFSIFAQALDGRRTLTISFNVSVISGSTVTVSGILLPPILSVPSNEKRPIFLLESGLARHNSTVTTFTNNTDTITKQASTNSGGEWALTVDKILHLGTHTVSALVEDGGGGQSVLTNPESFQILLSADLSIDNLVGLTDFSILMFNYGTSNPPNLAADINDNGGTVDLVDFSVMMFYWTGD